MKVLFETERMEIIDPQLTSMSSRRDIIAATRGYDDILVVWVFDREKRTMDDITEKLVPAYPYGFDDQSPPWVQQSPLFETLRFEEELDAEETAQHRASLKSPSLYL